MPRFSARNTKTRPVKSRRVKRHVARPHSFAEVAKSQIEGTDFRVHVRRRPNSTVAILAPHGGAIESGTSEIARAIAADDFNLYLFEGTRPSGNYAALHVTSHRFDESRCLELPAQCDHVVAIHGYTGEASDILLGGLDTELKTQVDGAIKTVGIPVRSTNHRFMGREPKNICNRGRRGVGVQLELSVALRERGVPGALITAVRSVLLKL